MLSHLRLTILQRYLLRQFTGVLLLCLFAATSLFLVFETFERMRVFIRENTTVFNVLSYLLFKVPLIIQLMMPIAVLIATLISIGRLSQLSEITAMRACGASVLSLAKPFIFAGLIISVLMFAAGETIVPWATQRGQEVYQLDIRKKDVKGNYSRQNFWYRVGKRFYSIGFYDSRDATLTGISMYDVDEHHHLKRRIDAAEANWGGPLVGWTMKNVVEVDVAADKRFNISRFKTLPLVIKEKPEDFFNVEWTPETLSYRELKKHVEKLAKEGTAPTRSLVDLDAKIAFPLVNLIAVLIAFPFALIPSRSGNLTASFVAGVTIGFGYHVVHAASTSFGAAELIPITASAWTANLILGCIGAYLMAGADYS